MPTVVERLATLEALVRENTARLDTLTDLIDGGGDMAWDRSVRGRLHAIESTLAGFVLRRSVGSGFLKGWQRFALTAAAIATAAAAWYSAVSH